MRSNPIGHTIFVTGEKKNRTTNHKPDTIFFTSEKVVSDFPAIWHMFELWVGRTLLDRRRIL